MVRKKGGSLATSAISAVEAKVAWLRLFPETSPFPSQYQAVLSRSMEFWASALAEY